MVDMQALFAQQAAVAQQIADAKQQFRGDAVVQAKQLIDQFELSPEEVGFVPVARSHGSKPARSQRKTSAAPAKYQDPETGKTWSGHGRRPAWFNGRSPDELRVL